MPRKHRNVRKSSAHKGWTPPEERDSLDDFFARQKRRFGWKLSKQIARCRERQLDAASDHTRIEQRGFTTGGHGSNYGRMAGRAEGRIEGIVDATDS